MATYKIDRSSSLELSGKFKFDYQINFIVSDFNAGPGAVDYFPSAAAYPTFELKSVSCSMYIGDPLSPLDDPNQKAETHPWTGNYSFGQFYDITNKFIRIPVTFFFHSPGGIIANDITYKGGYVENYVLYVEAYDALTDKVLSGSVEGEFFVGLGTNEFVDIDEYYPSENYFSGSPVCPDNEDEFWRNKELTKDTVRQWPKYTSLNWYETIDRNSKSYVGYKLKFTNPKGQVTKVSKAFLIPNPAELDILAPSKKFINAWTTNTFNSGYVSISSNVPVDSGDPDFVKKDHSQCDTQNYFLQPFPGATITDSVKCTATISLTSDAPRKVTFESKILDWNNAHTDPLTAYVIVFNSDGKNKKI